MINLVTIGNKIRRIRTVSGITQADFAVRAGVSRATISAIENGSIREIGINRLMEIVRCADSIQPQHKPLEIKTSLRKSQTLRLSFPYDWSNPSLKDEVLIDRVIERGIFEDIVRIYATYGENILLARVESFIQKNPAASNSLNRILDNILKAAKVV